MELILIKCYKHLSIYENDWSAILEANKNTNSFIEYKFFSNWWQFLGQNEVIEIYAVKEHHRIIAFFPFQLKKKWFGYKMQFLDTGNANYIDIIAKKRDVDRVIMFVFDNIIQQKKSVVFHLQGFLESGGNSFKLSNYLIARNIKEQYSRMNSKYYTSSTIFSTNTIRARTFRNFLWVRENLLKK